jgi:hypothetical protein
LDSLTAVIVSTENMTRSREKTVRRIVKSALGVKESSSHVLLRPVDWTLENAALSFDAMAIAWFAQGA